MGAWPRVRRNATVCASSMTAACAVRESECRDMTTNEMGCIRGATGRGRVLVHQNRITSRTEQVGVTGPHDRGSNVLDRTQQDSLSPWMGQRLP